MDTIHISTAVHLPEFVALLGKDPKEPEAVANLSDCAPPDTFRHWTQCISQGDEAAFTEFHRLYSSRVYKYLLALARGREADAREVLQTAMVKAARKFKPFEDEAELSAWLFRLARNAWFDFCRRRSRAHRFVPFESCPEASIANDSMPYDTLRTALCYAIEQLSPDEKELIQSAYVDDIPLKALAAETGQSYKALESRLGRIKSRLKSRLLKLLRNESRF
ncbi:MAG TPA: sigma-70 family RNA polymerase sigma factor [Verrucomicrobiae bacterium]|nr:sigma-70 family RNA polymerase sigma factor [Verrucomicrobiae bacterium]